MTGCTVVTVNRAEPFVTFERGLKQGQCCPRTALWLQRRAATS